MCSLPPGEPLGWVSVSEKLPEPVNAAKRPLADETVQVPVTSRREPVAVGVNVPRFGAKPRRTSWSPFFVAYVSVSCEFSGSHTSVAKHWMKNVVSIAAPIFGAVTGVGVPKYQKAQHSPWLKSMPVV